MKIGIAQTKPIPGDLAANIANHAQWIERAVMNGVELLIFPELSLTGYEPTLAKELALEPDDPRLDDIQALSDTHGISVGVGVPTPYKTDLRISLLVFRPHTPRHVYSKTYLHPDEEAFFVPGQSAPRIQVNHTNIALAICYEIFVPEHWESALKSGPEIYVASVAKFVDGIHKAVGRLSTLARDGRIPVCMSNCVGFADGSHCAGKSSVWNDQGLLIGQLNDVDEGMLIFDTASQMLVKSMTSGTGSKG